MTRILSTFEILDAVAMGSKGAKKEATDAKVIINGSVKDMYMNNDFFLYFILHYCNCKWVEMAQYSVVALYSFQVNISKQT